MSGLALPRALAAGGFPPGRAEEDRLEQLVERRLSGEPLQHVLGSWSFRRVDLTVDGRALVPRPETEVVTGYALEVLASLRREPGERLLALDLGTGSGAIACSLVREEGSVEVVAVDASPSALELAAENRARLEPGEATRLGLRLGSWYEPVAELAGRVALVVSNPPYLAAAEWAGLERVVREFDPKEALVAGEGGLEAIEAVLAGAPGVLRPGGAAVVELAPHQGDEAKARALLAGAASAELFADLAGRVRCLVARW